MLDDQHGCSQVRRQPSHQPGQLLRPAHGSPDNDQVPVSHYLTRARLRAALREHAGDSEAACGDRTTATSPAGLVINGRSELVGMLQVHFHLRQYLLGKGFRIRILATVDFLLQEVEGVLMRFDLAFDVVRIERRP